MSVTHPGRAATDGRPGVWYWGRRLTPSIALTPLRIALAYAVFGFLALYLSDVLFVQYFSDPLLGQVQALKGGVEIVLTAGFVFAVAGRRESQLRRSLDRLDRQREELQVLHRVLRHNLRNDLNVIQGRADMVAEGPSVDRFQEHCEKILETAAGMTRYTEQATRINDITAGDGRIRRYDLSEAISRVLEKYPQGEATADVSAQVPDGVAVEANSMFEEALGELVENAVEHNDAERPEVTIEVDPDRGPSHVVEIRVADNGPGIPRREVNALNAGEENQLLHLSGMGLWFVVWTVRHSGGQLRFEDREGRGTTAVVRVPKAPEMLSSWLSLVPGV